MGGFKQAETIAMITIAHATIEEMEKKKPTNIQEFNELFERVIKNLKERRERISTGGF